MKMNTLTKQLQKLVVVNEHTLGAIFPEQPNQVQILQASILLGAVLTWQDGLLPISPLDKIRLASPNDFTVFHVHFGGFNNPAEYEFENNI